MTHMTITCPFCGFTKDIEQSAIPPNVTRATCPKCRQVFDLGAAMKERQPLPETFAEETVVPPPELPPSQPPKPRSIRTLRFTFTGNSREYFGIWIVNTLLKILTFGIYSAWAKVRKRRYFYGNTLLSSASFEYLADPKALFRGWLIAALFFILYSVGTKVSPVLASVMGLIFFAAMPWLIVRSKMFNQRNSAHRNIRFNFRPEYREAYVVFAGIPFLLPFTLGMIFPYMIYRQKRFLVENSAYGRSSCTFEASPKDFYMVFLKAFGWFMLIMVLFFIGMYFMSATFRQFYPLFIGSGGTSGETYKKGMFVAVLFFFLAVNFLYLFFAIYVQTSLANLTWNGTRIRNNRFSSTLRVRDMAWLYVSSAVAIFFSLGLLIPWATIRLTRYRLENLCVHAADDLESFASVNLAEVGPAGEEIGDLFGIDVAL